MKQGTEIGLCFSSWFLIPSFQVFMTGIFVIRVSRAKMSWAGLNFYTEQYNFIWWLSTCRIFAFNFYFTFIIMLVHKSVPAQNFHKLSWFIFRYIFIVIFTCSLLFTFFSTYYKIYIHDWCYGNMVSTIYGFIQIFDYNFSSIKNYDGIFRR